MAVNKVVYGGKTLIDLTGDTVTTDKLLKGITAHGKDGEVAQERARLTWIPMMQLRQLRRS